METATSTSHNMIGALVGDIVGSVYEFNNIKSKDFVLFSSKCTVTDDSVMTIATADWILGGDEPALSYAHWGYKYPHAGYGPSFSEWIRMATLYGYAPSYNSCGNGSAMRVSPVGWAFNSESEILEYARYSAVCTHDHPEGIKGAQAIAMGVYMARTGAPKDEIRQYMERQFGYDLSFTLDGIRPTYGWHSEFGNGVLCQASVPQAIVAFLEGEDFEDCIRGAISIGGDSDTIGCMTGAIAGAFYGIPEDIIRKAEQFIPQDMRSVMDQFIHKYIPQSI